MMSIAYNLRTSATLRGKVLSGALTPEALCQLSSEQLAEGTAIGTARQKAKTKAAAQITLKSEDLEVVVEQKEGGTKMVRDSHSPRFRLCCCCRAASSTPSSFPLLSLYIALE